MIGNDVFTTAGILACERCDRAFDSRDDYHARGFTTRLLCVACAHELGPDAVQAFLRAPRSRSMPDSSRRNNDDDPER